MRFWDRLLGRPDPDVVALREWDATLQERVGQLETQLQETSTKLKEVNALAQLYDPDLNLTAAQGGSQYMRRLTQSARDFAPLQHAKALKLAFWLWESNPLARRILGTTAAYIIGDGFSFSSDYKEEGFKEDVQGVIDRFWNDHVNLMDLNMPGYVLELGMFGELCLTFKVNPVSGLVRIDSVDSENISDLIFKGTDLIALELKATGGIGRPERLKIIRMDEDPNSKTYGLLVGAATDAQGETIETWYDSDTDGKPSGEPHKYLGSCMFFRVNNIKHAKRGRSDLLTVMDWLDAYDQSLFNELERSQLMKAFIWDVKLVGKTEAEIKDWLTRNGAPKSGAVRGHNEGVEWNAVNPDLKAYDTGALSELILSHISTGSQYPKTWLNVTDKVNKATGQVLDEPTFRWMSVRQRYVRYILTQMINYQLDCAELAGVLDARPKQSGSITREEWQITVNVTELRPKDIKLSGETFALAMSGLVNAVTEHFIDLKTAQRLAVLLIEEFGLDVDIDEMMKSVEEEIQKKQDEMVPPVVPPPPTGQPQPAPAPTVLPKVKAA